MHVCCLKLFLMTTYNTYSVLGDEGEMNDESTVRILQSVREKVYQKLRCVMIACDLDVQFNFDIL